MAASEQNISPPMSLSNGIQYGISKLTLILLVICGVMLVPTILSKVVLLRRQFHQLHGQPKLHVAEAIRDLGRVRRGTNRDAFFPVENRGARRLVINELDRGCGCNDRFSQTFLVQPNEVANLRVALDNPRTAGPVMTTSHFTTNDPSLPHFSLTVRGWIDREDVSQRAEVLDDELPSVLSRR